MSSSTSSETMRSIGSTSAIIFLLWKKQQRCSQERQRERKRDEREKEMRYRSTNAKSASLSLSSYPVAYHPPPFMRAKRLLPPQETSTGTETEMTRAKTCWRCSSVYKYHSLVSASCSFFRYHSNSPNWRSKVPDCSVSNRSVKRGPISCRRTASKLSKM